jgi:hypothetical protein
MSAAGRSEAVRRAATVILLVGIWGADASAQTEGPRVTWYGYTKLDASWDENAVSAGNFARWVVSPETVAPHAHFNMTARQTRVGLRMKSEIDGAVVQGLWEVDFYGGGAENKNGLQVRHAYVEASWPSGWKLLAGQASDVISPLAPSTLNYVVAWWSGNVGYRRPQLRVSKESPLGSARLTVTGAVTRTIGDDFGSDPGDTGTDSGMPTVQGRMGLSWPMGDKQAAVGLYAHGGKETLDPELYGDPMELTSSGWGGDVSLPLGPVVLSGEAWTGTNGVAMGPLTASGVTGSGGWAQVAWDLGENRFHVGAGVDDPDEADLSAGGRARNLSYWASVQRDIGAGLSHGIEVSRWVTDYVGLDRGTSLRVQMSVIYSF